MQSVIEILPWDNVGSAVPICKVMSLAARTRSHTPQIRPGNFTPQPLGKAGWCCFNFCLRDEGIASDKSSLSNLTQKQVRFRSFFEIVRIQRKAQDRGVQI